MISRFFKKKPKAAEPKRAEPEKSRPSVPRRQSPTPKKILTAEGWKRMMMRKTGKIK